MKRNFAYSVLATASVILGMPVLAAAQQPSAAQTAARDAAIKAAAGKPTPRTADSHPDLSGKWRVSTFQAPPTLKTDGGKGVAVLFSVTSPEDTGTSYTETEAQQADKRFAANPNKPVYKPQFVAKYETGARDPNHHDPTWFVCKPQGVPRIGPPTEIVQTPDRVILLYQQSAVRSSSVMPDSTFRLIPTDGRAHRSDVDPSAMGDSVGHWEGDTLVVDVTRFSDTTWFGNAGEFHTEAMHVVERFTRKGNALEYNVTVEDPSVLAKPWTTPKQTLMIATPEEAELFYQSDSPCVDNDSIHMVTRDHH